MLRVGASRGWGVAAPATLLGALPEWASPGCGCDGDGNARIGGENSTSWGRTRLGDCEDQPYGATPQPREAPTRSFRRFLNRKRERRSTCFEEPVAMWVVLFYRQDETGAC